MASGENMVQDQVPFELTSPYIRQLFIMTCANYGRFSWGTEYRRCAGLSLCLLVCLLTGSGKVCSQGVAADAELSVSKSGAELFGEVIAKQKQQDTNLETYERIERTEVRKTGRDAKPSDVKVMRVFPAGTGMFKEPLTAEGKPLSLESYREALEKLETTLAWAAQNGPAQTEAYAKVERRRKDRYQLIDATRRAFHFKKMGEEMRGNRVLLKYEMTPNPDYKPMSRNETLFTRVKGTVWIDKESSELAKVEGSVTEDISIALFLAKVYKGSYFMQERYEFAPGVWMPSYQQYDFDGRKFLVPFSIHERTFYTEYKRVGAPKESVEAVRIELNKLKESGSKE